MALDGATKQKYGIDNGIVGVTGHELRRGQISRSEQNVLITWSISKRTSFSLDLVWRRTLQSSVRKCLNTIRWWCRGWKSRWRVKRRLVALSLSTLHSLDLASEVNFHLSTENSARQKKNTRNEQKIQKLNCHSIGIVNVTWATEHTAHTRRDGKETDRKRVKTRLEILLIDISMSHNSIQSHDIKHEAIGSSSTSLLSSAADDIVSSFIDLCAAFQIMYFFLLFNYEFIKLILSLSRCGISSSATHKINRMENKLKKEKKRE